MTEGATAGASRENRRAIPVSCALHRGPRGFANLVVERKRDGEIVFDPHVAGACVIIFDEDAATALFEALPDVAAPMSEHPATVPGAREGHPVSIPRDRDERNRDDGGLEGIAAGRG